MSDILLILTPVLAFFGTLLIIPVWLRAAKKAGLIGKDINKYNAPEVAEAGGLAVIIGFIFAVMAYLIINNFIFHNIEYQLEIFAITTAILFIAVFGLVDDTLGWKIGLRQWQKPILTIIAAVPLIIINAGTPAMNVPLIGAVHLGLLYPLVIVPIGIVGASNGFNMLAGYNGLEAGMGAIILSFMGYIAWNSGLYWLVIMVFAMVFALLGFLVYNRYPARIFPGDTLTYTVGAFIAIVAIIGNMEKIAVVLFIPYFIEFILKLRHRFKTENFGVPQKDGTLRLSCVEGQNQIFSFTHIVIKILLKINKKSATERNVVRSIWGIELILVAFCFLLFL